MKLFVDDVRTAPWGWTTVRNSEDAIRMIATMGADEISLDHDAGGRDTFQPVAYYIAAKWVDMPETQVPKIVIHSSNPAGAEKLMKILQGAGIMSEYKPFNAEKNDN